MYITKIYFVFRCNKDEVKILVLRFSAQFMRYAYPSTNTGTPEIPLAKVRMVFLGLSFVCCNSRYNVEFQVVVVFPPPNKRLGSTSNQIRLFV